MIGVKSKTEFLRFFVLRLILSELNNLMAICLAKKYRSGRFIESLLQKTFGQILFPTYPKFYPEKSLKYFSLKSYLTIQS